MKKFLKDEGAYSIKYWGGVSLNGKKYTKNGVPDLLVCIDGCFMGLELKAPTGKASELQKAHLKQIDKAGGLAILLYPEDFGKFKELIRCIKSMSIEAQMDIYEEMKGRWC